MQYAEFSKLVAAARGAGVPLAGLLHREIEGLVNDVIFTHMMDWEWV